MLQPRLVEILEVVPLVKKWAALVGAGCLLVGSNAVANDTTPDVEIWLGEKVGRFGDYTFSVNGGSKQFPTPTGAYEINWKSRNWWSKQWQAPMPYAMFFCNGAAIHVGSMSGSSHGCVRVPESAAKYLFAKTKEKVTRVFVYP